MFKYRVLTQMNVNMLAPLASSMAFCLVINKCDCLPKMVNKSDVLIMNIN